MKLIKILVADQEEAEEFTSFIEEGEAHGLFDFPFSVRITEDMSSSDAKHNFYNEEK